jgi:hypothetical protein
MKITLTRKQINGKTVTGTAKFDTNRLGNLLAVGNDTYFLYPSDAPIPLAYLVDETVAQINTATTVAVV